MPSVVITNKQTGAVVAQVPLNWDGLNYTPRPAEYSADAWRIAIEDQLIEADSDKDDYTFEMVPVSMHDAFSEPR